MTNFWMEAAPWLAIALGYLLGSLSFAVLVSRWAGLDDPRRYGSGNPGATNVLRSGNKAAAVLTLLLDAGKGALAVAAVQHWGPAWGLYEGTAAMTGLAALAGHIWPVFFGFKGGKGVATAAGVLLVLQFWLGLITLGVWLFVAATTRISSLAALIAALAAPLVQILVWGLGPVAGAAFGMALVLVLRHRANIERLLTGTEPKMGQKSKSKDPAGPGRPSPSATHKPRRR